jgi:uncharacterized membrane protein YcaP (DUF421 family)
VFLDDAMADAVVRGLILAALGLVWVIALTRLVGLRSFSKMTTFDFVMTVATGSLLAGASQATNWTGFVQPLAAIAGLFAMQYAVARFRRASDRFENLVQNTPKVLMRDGEIDEAALRETRVARNDLFAKLREANVRDPDDVRAVVLETTGDITVLHGDGLDRALMTGTRRARADAGA